MKNITILAVAILFLSCSQVVKPNGVVNIYDSGNRLIFSSDPLDIVIIMQKKGYVDFVLRDTDLKKFETATAKPPIPAAVYFDQQKIWEGTIMMQMDTVDLQVKAMDMAGLIGYLKQKGYNFILQD